MNPKKLHPSNSLNHTEPLPWQKPKSIHEDPQAMQKIEAIQSSPSYIVAKDDTAFLSSSETTGIRLELDYLKAELSLQKHGIEHTIAVFGSTRIIEYKQAMDQLQNLHDQLKQNPKDEKLLKKLRIAERVLEKSRYYDIAREFGRLVGACGKGVKDNRVMLLTGGGPGIMEAANRGAYDVDAKSIGLNITLPHEQFPNPYITPELCFQFYYFVTRKMHFVQRAKALVVFPGGYGTLDELFETLTLIQTQKIKPVPIVFVGESYWTKLIDFDFLEEEGVISCEDRALFCFVESAKEAWEEITQWHKENETALF